MHVIRVELKGFPYLGIWSAANDSPFVCIDPWFGVDSTEGDSTGVYTKGRLEKLSPNESFACGYTMEFAFE